MNIIVSSAYWNVEQQQLPFICNTCCINGHFILSTLRVLYRLGQPNDIGTVLGLLLHHGITRKITFGTCLSFFMWHVRVVVYCLVERYTVIYNDYIFILFFYTFLIIFIMVGFFIKSLVAVVLAVSVHALAAIQSLTSIAKKVLDCLNVPRLTKDLALIAQIFFNHHNMPLDAFNCLFSDVLILKIETDFFGHGKKIAKIKLVFLVFLLQSPSTNQAPQPNPSQSCITGYPEDRVYMIALFGNKPEIPSTRGRISETVTFTSSFKGRDAEQEEAWAGEYANTKFGVVWQNTLFGLDYYIMQLCEKLTGDNFLDRFSGLLRTAGGNCKEIAEQQFSDWVKVLYFLQPSHSWLTSTLAGFIFNTGWLILFWTYALYLKKAQPNRPYKRDGGKEYHVISIFYIFCFSTC
ncbi:hypothetical protein ACJX0J_035875 [Zea mays]